jgi:hypothetical protein
MSKIQENTEVDENIIEFCKTAIFVMGHILHYETEPAESAST